MCVKISGKINGVFLIIYDYFTTFARETKNVYVFFIFCRQNMLKVLLLFVLLISTTTMWAQEVSVERSQTVIEQSGKRFYLHVVQPGQTFFSICKEKNEIFLLFL